MMVVMVIVMSLSDNSSGGGIPRGKLIARVWPHRHTFTRRRFVTVGRRRFSSGGLYRQSAHAAKLVAFAVAVSAGRAQAALAANLVQAVGDIFHIGFCRQTLHDFHGRSHGVLVGLCAPHFGL